MSRFYFCPFLLLEIFYFCAVLGGETKIYEILGDSKQFDINDPPGILEKCEATHMVAASNPTHELIHDPFDTHLRIKQGVVRSYPSGNCSVFFYELSYVHRGKWIIRTHYKSNETDETKQSEEIIYIHLIEIYNHEPNFLMTARKGQFVIAHGVKHVGHGACSLSGNGRPREDRIYDLNAPMNKSEGIKRLGADCDILIVVEARTEGAWTIIQESDAYYLRETYFQIGIYEDNRPQKESWYQGSATKMNLSPRYANDFCELIFPNKSSIQLESPICNYTVPHVTKEHAGLWTARYRLEHSGEFVEEYFKIEILAHR